MNGAQRLTTVYAGLRIVYAIGLLAVPGRVARPWVGETADNPGTAVAFRGLGARDLALSVGVALAVRTGADARPWLAACAVSDTVDLTATLGAPQGALPSRAKPGAAALAGGFGVLGAALATRDELSG